MAVKVYDAKAVSLIAFNFSIEEGRDPDAFVKVAYESDAFEVVKDATGGITRCATRDFVAEIEINLLASSKHNAVLSAIHVADLAATNGSGVGTFLLKDNNGSTLVAGQAWIHKAPDISMGSKIGTYTWKLKGTFPPGTLIVGGN